MRELILDNARLDLAGGFTTIGDVGSTPLVDKLSVVALREDLPTIPTLHELHGHF